MNDKLKHLIASALIMFALAIPAKIWLETGEPPYYYVGLAYVLTLVIGLGKEVYYDKYLNKGTYDLWDIFFNFIGATVALMLIQAI